MNSGNQGSRNNHNTQGRPQHSSRGGSGQGGRNSSSSHHGGSHTSPQKKIVIPDFNDRELVGKKAEDIVDILCARKDSYGKSKDLTTSQLRNFFGEIRNIERILSSSSEKEKTWGSLYPRIKLIKAKAIYNANRQSGKISQSYKDFLSGCIDKIPSDYTEGTRAFKGFCQLFEAVVGYSSQYTKN